MRGEERKGDEVLARGKGGFGGRKGREKGKGKRVAISEMSHEGCIRDLKRSWRKRRRRNRNKRS